MTGADHNEPEGKFESKSETSETKDPAPTGRPSETGEALAASTASAAEAVSLVSADAAGSLPAAAAEEESATGEVELIEATPTPMVLPIEVSPAPAKRPPPLPKGPPPAPPNAQLAPPLPPLRRLQTFFVQTPATQKSAPAPGAPVPVITAPLDVPKAASTPIPVSAPAEQEKAPAHPAEPTRPSTVAMDHFAPDAAIADARRRVEQAVTGDRAAFARAKTELGLLLEVTAGDAAAALGEYRAAHGVATGMLAPLVAARRLTPFRPAGPALALLEAELRATTDPDAKTTRELELGMLLAASTAPSERTWQSFRRVLAKRPSHPGALRGLEAALAAAPRAAETLLQTETLATHLETMAGVFRGDRRLSAWLEVERGQLLDKLGRGEAARAAFETALSLDGQLGPVRDAHVRHLVEHDQVEALVRAWVSEAEIEADGARAARLLYFAARLASERIDQKAVAIQLFERAAHREGAMVSTQRAALRELWRLYDASGSLEASVATGERLLALAHDSETAYFHRRLVQSCEALGRWVDVAAHAHQVLAAEPEDEGTRDQLDRALAGLGQHAQRVAMFTELAARTATENARIALLLRAAEIAEHDLANRNMALLALRSAWAIDPAHADVTDAIVRLLTPGTPPSPTDPNDPARVRARIDFYVEAAAAAESARRVAHLEKLALIWEDEVRDPVRALAVYREILGIEPTRRSAILGLARCAARAGDAREHLRALVLEADLSEDDLVTERALLLRASTVALRDLSDPDAALALSKRVLARNPGDPVALRLAFRIHERAGQQAEALDHLRLLLAQTGKGQSPYPVQAEIARFLEERMHRPADALVAWREAHRIAPANPTPRAELRRILLGNGDHRPVAEELAGLAAVTADAAQRGELLVEAAEIYDDRLNAPERAIPLLAEARTCLPDDPAVAERLERAYLRTGKRAERLALLLATETPEARSQLALGIMMVDDRDPGKALKRLADLTVNPSVSVAALRTMERALRRADRPHDLDMVLRKQIECFETREAKLGSAFELVALEEYAEVEAPEGQPPAREVLAQLDPDSLLYHDLLLRKTSLASDAAAPFDEVSTSLATLAAAAPDTLTGATLHLARALIVEMRPEATEDAKKQALIDYAIALDAWPDCLTAARGLYRMANRFGEAQTFVKAATALGSLELDGHTRCERLLEAAEGLRSRLGDGAQANDLVCRALAENPNSPRAADVVIAALAQGLDPGKASETLRAALDKALSPDHAARLGTALANVALGALGDPTVALEALRRARKRAPKHVGNLLALADVSMALGLHAEAVEAASSAMGISREPAERLHATITLAEVHARAPAFRDTARREAREAEKLAEQAGGGHGDLIVRLGTVFRSLGDEQGAERVLMRAVLLATESVATMDSLCDLFGGGREGAEKAVAALGKVIAVAESNGRPKRAEWLAVIGKLEATVLDKPREGLGRLRDAVRMAPGCVDIYAALGDAHAASPGEAIREVGALLAEFGAAKPTRDQTVAMLSVLSRLARQAQRPASAAALDELLALLRSSQPGQPPRAPHTLPAGTPFPRCLPRDTLVASLLPDETQSALLETAMILAEAAPKWIRQEPEAFGTASSERLSSRGSHPVRALADRIARAFGDLQFDIYLDAPATRVGRVLSGAPAALVLPPEFTELPELEQAAELARLLAYVALDIPWVDDATPETVDGILFGALRVGSELWGQGELSPDADRNAGLWRARIVKGVGRRLKRSLEEAAQKVRPQTDSSLWRQAVRSVSVRAAYVITDDLPASMGQVLRADREPLDNPGDALSARLFEYPVSRDLILFALSEAALALRQSADSG
jgi:cellulose synthase operon protein C